MINIFNNNKTIWIISILVAVLLWMYVITEQNPKTFDNLNNIPIKLANTESLAEKGLVISDPQDYSMDIRVYGRRNRLYKINKDKIELKADLSTLTSKGTHYVPVTINGLPEDIEISKKSPETIKITLDQIVTQERKIKIEITGKPADGMATLAFVANPSTASMEGPEKILNSIREIVAVVDISNANQEINQKLPLKAIDSNGKEVKDIKLTPETVDVTIPVGPTKIIPIDPQVIGKVKEGYIITSVDTNPKNVLVGGTTEELDQISRILTERISVDGKMETFEKKIKLLLPQGVEVINSESAVVVKVTIEPYIEKNFQLENLNVINLKEDFVIQENLMDIPVVVTLKGPKTQIEKLNNENIELILDAKDLEEGQQEITPQVKVPNGITVEKIEPKVMQIHIQGKAE